MAQQYEKLNERLTNFISQQQMFLVGSSPQSGRVNVSPKGYLGRRWLEHIAKPEEIARM